VRLRQGQGFYDILEGEELNLPHLPAYFCGSLSKIAQTQGQEESTSSSMIDAIRILTTELDGDDGLIVAFSDGTTGAYVVEELLELRPFRERVTTKKATNPRTKP